MPVKAVSNQEVNTDHLRVPALFARVVFYAYTNLHSSQIA